MKVATGIAIGAQAKPELAAKAVQAAMLRANIHAPSSVLLFLSAEFANNPEAAIKAAAKAANCTQIIGCSATGIFTEDDWVIDGPAAAAMVFSESVFTPINFNQNNVDANSSALLLTLTAPNAINTTWLQSKNARFGGVSGDAIGQGAYSVWANAKGASQGYCDVMLNNLDAAIAATHGLKLLSAPGKITACKALDVQRIDNFSALNSLEVAWRSENKTFSPMPYHRLMAVVASESALITRGEYNTISIIGDDEKTGSVTLAKPLQNGDWLSWAIRDTDAAQIDLVKTASGLRRELGHEPEFGLLFSGIGRGPYFYNGVDQDLLLLKALYPNLPLIGFYGNGQIAPIHGVNTLLDYSAVLGLFSIKS
jgi:small ligand-binding sensory domain FIST